MEAKSFVEVLDFAIQREEAAYAFYEGLAGQAAFAAQRSTLREFRDMEKGHAALLRGVKARGELDLSAKPAVELGLAAFLVAEEETPPDLSFQDILVLALKKEERAGSLYASLAASSQIAGLGGLFERLAAEEGRHKRYFEELYEKEIARDN